VTAVVSACRAVPILAEHVLPAPVGEVHDLFLDSDFLCAYAHATLAGRSLVTVSPDRLRTSLRRVQPTDSAPPFLAPVIGPEVDIVEVVRWDAPGPGQWGRRALLRVEALVAPREARFTGVMTLEPASGDAQAAAACRWTVDGGLWVKASLIGGKVAPLLTDAVQTALATQARLAGEWLRR